MAALTLPLPAAQSSQSSLLDAITSTQQQQTPFLRIMYVARLAKRESSSLNQHSFMSRLIDKHAHDCNVTGLLLVYPQVLVHMLEAPAEALHTLLHALAAAPPTESHLAEAKVVLAMEGLPSRAFSSWAAAFVPSNSSLEVADPAVASQVVKSASEAAAVLRQLGTSLGVLSEAEQTRIYSNLASHTEDLPLPELLLPLAASHDAPSIGQYLGLLAQPHPMVDTDGELAWPLDRADLDVGPVGDRR